MRMARVHELMYERGYICPYATRDVARLEAENERLREALNSIAANTCCDPCQEAKRVAQAALAKARGGE